MKKILLFLVALVATLSMNAQTTEIHNASGKVAAYLGADVNVKFGMDGSDPTIMVYKGDKLQKTYTGSEYKVVSTPVEEAFKAVYDTNGGANTLTFYYDAVDHSGNGITVYDNLPTAATMAADWGYDSIREDVKEVVINASVKNYSSLTSTAYMFRNISNAVKITGAEYLDVSNVTNMTYMFSNFGGGKSGSPTTLNVVPDVSKWNTGNVKYMNGMFESYGNFSSSLDKVPDVSDWNTGNVANMDYMFQKYGYGSQTFNAVPDVSKWNTGNVTNMANMFFAYGYSSTALNAVPDVSKWNTGKAENMFQMFLSYGHSSTALNTVPNVSNWNTGNVTNMTNMFYGYGHTSTNISCVLDLSGWNLANVTSGEGVFGFKQIKTFSVTIPGKTGDKANDASHWYYGDGTNSIAPPEGKSFTMFGTGSAAVKAEAGVSGNKVKWVRLWEGGPKFAEYNVGVTDGKAESYGGYYAWGGSQDKVDDHNTTNTGSGNLTGTDDTATNLWGSNWRMPTQTELEVLLANCEVELTTVGGVNGRKFTGKGDYASNSVFLPAAGECYGGSVSSQGSYGNYWSSTPDDSDCAYFLLFESGSSYWRVGYRLRRNGYSVRAVVRDPVAVTGVSLNKTTLELGVGASETLTPTFIPADADNKNVSWASDNESVATVDANGKVTAVAIGEATITVTTEDGNKTATCKLAVFPAGSVGTIKAKIGEKDVDVKWVQLWAGGPKFAEYNVGATPATEYGEYYAWGGSQNKVDDHNTGSSALSGDSDTATNLWGNNWRMPTSEEFDALLSNCDFKWTKNYNGTGIAGRIFTGKGDYAANSIFLPAAGKGTGESQGSAGYYWSSTPGDDKAYALGFASSMQSVFNTSRSTIYSVRAVVNDTGTAKATIGGVEKEVKWIQLWEGGPKFAEYNIGATSATDYGGYYCWGKATNKDSQSAYKGGTSALTGTDDTATNLWGSNWRMPTNTDFSTLISNCTCTWKRDYNGTGVNGLLCTGKGDYISNSIFLPAAGVCNSGTVINKGVKGEYWSSTPDGSKNAYELSMSSTFKLVNTNSRVYGFSVRAVLAE